MRTTIWLYAMFFYTSMFPDDAANIGYLVMILGLCFTACVYQDIKEIFR